MQLPIRPAVLQGITHTELTHHGYVYITVNYIVSDNPDEHGWPMEVFIHMPGATPCDKSYTEALARLISLNLRSGIRAGEMVAALREITCEPIATAEGFVHSIPDAVAHVLAYWMIHPPAILEKST